MSRAVLAEGRADDGVPAMGQIVGLIEELCSVQAEASAVLERWA